MLAARNLQKQSLKALSSLFLLNPSTQNAMAVRDGWPKLGVAGGVIEAGLAVKDASFTSMRMWNGVNGARGFSAKSMRSKVERRMRHESGKTLRERRRAVKLRKKLMTDEERLIYNLRRAKKKVALLLQKLKKYELPELPTPRHDPELLTPEQLQAYKKIGYKNRNYVPVGVRGVFGGVVQNMHLHWKFHETVQVCCDNFPKEKIKEMASMLARLSGGVVINIHNVKTIIMFRGRNYRQPKNLIPINTLTKRKALFKARFEQALESQKLNIKKIEQELRRKGVNPDDPVAMASIQRVASTFFNAIDRKEGSPYVFQKDKRTEFESLTHIQQPEPGEDSDQEELDRFIAEIEAAADKEWAAEEAAEKEEFGKIRYWNREELSDRFRRSEQIGDVEYDNNIRGRSRNWNGAKNGRNGMNASDKEDRDMTEDDDNEDRDSTEDDECWDPYENEDTSEHETDGDEFNKAPGKSVMHNVERLKLDNILKTNKSVSLKSSGTAKLNLKKTHEDSVSEDTLSDLDDAMYESDDGEGQNNIESRLPANDYRRSSDEDYYDHRETDNKNRMAGIRSSFNNAHSSEEMLGGFGLARAGRMKDDEISRSNATGDTQRHHAKLTDLFGESDAKQNLISGTSRNVNDNRKKEENAELVRGNRKIGGNTGKFNNPRDLDETWDSD